MKKQITLNVVPRTVVGKKVKQIRREGWVPMAMYGPGFEPEIFQAAAFETNRALAQAGMTSLILLQVEGRKKPYDVLVRDVQRNVVTEALVHVDLYRVSMTQKLTTEVPIELVGKSPAAMGVEVMVLTILDRVEIECLPADLVSALELDISSLKGMDDVLCVKDIPVPEGITILTDGDEVVVRLMSADRVVEEEVLPVEVAADRVEVISRAREEEEEREEA